MAKKIYVWSLTVRLTHWVNVVTVTILSLTGYAIGNPALFAGMREFLPMATVRFIHILSAYMLTASVFLRFYYMSTEDGYARPGELLPLKKERWRSFRDALFFYMFLRKSPPSYPGHNALAGVSYFFIFIAFATEIVTGFALHSQSHHGVLWWVLGGWMLNFTDAMSIRLIHHLLMWFLWVFVVIHLYISVHNDCFEKNGLISSIVNGYKIVDE
ncbi:MAG: Ni/Fe-hydrogenase, b-type cytochrome subunit [Nitrospirae bacterium]|nr:Ni/Fe-hydrogenase, b-type cytochrome subunit [Nitrospirota bacterium]